MPTISAEELKHHRQFVQAMEDDALTFRSDWKELSINYLPQRYRWLMTQKERETQKARRQYIINNTGTQAARTLAAGMMNGITSPSRPWFKLRIPGLDLEQHKPLAVWLEEVTRRMLQVMAQSNFYNSMAVMYLDMVVFGTAANIIYEDYDSVIRCYNPPLGEFMVASDDRGVITALARKFEMPIYKYITQWPDKNVWSDRVKNAVKTGGKALSQTVEICHFIGPNLKRLVPPRFSHYELYWESRRSQDGTGFVLSKSGYFGFPGIVGRWEVSGTDAYGVSPGMDALGDVMDLQHQHREKSTLLETQAHPPLLLDVALQNQPNAMLPRSKTFVPNLTTNAGAKPVFEVNPNFDQLTQDRISTEERIRNTFYNFLFTGITNLQTVRSAAEVELRESEKLILLGGVLERFESESLDPAIRRVYELTEKAGLLPEPPSGYENMELDIQYVSILSVAQRAVGTAPTERWLGLIGNLAAAVPDALDITDFDKLLINYAKDIGMRADEVRSMEEIMAIRQQRQQQQAAEQMAAAAPGLAQAGRNLSETEVGGGGNALDMLLGS